MTRTLARRSPATRMCLGALIILTSLSVMISSIAVLIATHGG